MKAASCWATCSRRVGATWWWISAPAPAARRLMLAALMRSQGRIYAFDTSEKRLDNLKPRLKRSGLSNVHPQLIADENDIEGEAPGGKIDRVLVDAPCSGLGTLRRNPD